MTQNMRELEEDIEQTRARLDLTIDRLQGKIQDKLSVSGVMDDLIGRGRQTRYASMFDDTLDVIKRNPIPVMLIAAGVGWLLHRIATDRGPPVRRSVVVRPVTRTEGSTVGVTARVYGSQGAGAAGAAATTEPRPIADEDVLLTGQPLGARTS